MQSGQIKLKQLQKKLNDNPVCIAADKCVGTKEALLRMSEAATKEIENLYDEYMRQTKADQKAQDDHIKSYAKKSDSIRKEKDTLNIQIVKLEKQRPINKQLDASQEAYPYVPLMNARVQSDAGTHKPAPTTFTSGRGAGRSSFTSGDADGNVLIPVDPRTGASANSFGQRGSDGGRPDMSGATQQAYPTAVRTGQGGRPLGSTTQRQGGAINPSTPAPSATGMSSPDSMGGLPQPGDSGYVNPNVLGRLARSVTDSTRYSGNMMFQGNPAG